MKWNFRKELIITVLIFLFSALLLYNVFKIPLIEGNDVESRIDTLWNEVYGDETSTDIGGDEMSDDISDETLGDNEEDEMNAMI